MCSSGEVRPGLKEGSRGGNRGWSLRMRRGFPGGRGRQRQDEHPLWGMGPQMGGAVGLQKGDSRVIQSLGGPRQGIRALSRALAAAWAVEQEGREV